MRIGRGEEVRDVRVEADAAVLDGVRRDVRRTVSAGAEILEVAGRRHVVRVARSDSRAFVWCDGVVFEFERLGRAERNPSERGDLLAPMPGRVRQVLVAPGEAVSRGQVLVILEAMKMEHAIRAPRDGVIRRIPHAAGDLVDAGAPLVEIAERPGPGP